MKNRSLRFDAAVYQMPDNNYPGLVQLHLNENLFASAIEKSQRPVIVGQDFDDMALHAYPKRGVEFLQESIANHLRCQFENVVIANGSSQLLRILFMYLLRADDVLLLPSPSWNFFAVTANLVGANVKYFQLSKNQDKFLYDHGSLDCAIRDQLPKVVLICSPNNPTGNSIGNADLLKLVNEHPEVNFIVDQAYHGFSTNHDDGSGCPIIREASIRHNLFVTRSFSKFMALANLRIGYLVCNRACVSNLSGLATVFGIPSFSQKFAIHRINDHALHGRIQNEYSQVREYFCGALREIDGLYPYETDANFVLVRYDARYRNLCERLLNQGFVVKSETIEGRAEYLRITMADIETMRAVVVAIEGLLSEHRVQ